MVIIGRRQEQEELRRLYNSGRPELVAIVGRRRIGKTFLVKEMFGNDMAFYSTGLVGKGINTAYQLNMFDNAIAKHGGVVKTKSRKWSEAFEKLEKLIESKNLKRQVIFIDEAPWLDTPKSDFLPALDYFWNSFASTRPDVMMIICGSAASWVTKNIFQNRGGLHNRVTNKINLAPFSLKECEELLKELGVVMSRYQIAESYMAFGGVPYYLNMFAKEFSLSQNIDRLIFAKNAPLGNEFTEVYHSLFRTPERHIHIVRALAKTKAGLTRDEIIKATKIPGGGNLTKALTELEQCCFIEKYADFTKTKNCMVYRLVDPFTLFWLKYVDENNTKDEYFWTNLVDDGGRRAWSGHAFEMLCLCHTRQIKQKLGISGVSSSVFTWRSKRVSPGAQIDLLIDRKDEVINLCEVKFSLTPFTITKEYEKSLDKKKVAFISETNTRKALHLTMITTYGLTDKGYHMSIQSQVTLNDLFT